MAGYGQMYYDYSNPNYYYSGAGYHPWSNYYSNAAYLPTYPGESKDSNELKPSVNSYDSPGKQRVYSFGNKKVTTKRARKESSESQGSSGESGSAIVHHVEVQEEIKIPPGTDLRFKIRNQSNALFFIYISVHFLDPSIERLSKLTMAFVDYKLAFSMLSLNMNVAEVLKEITSYNSDDALKNIAEAVDEDTAKLTSIVSDQVPPPEHLKRTSSSSLSGIHKKHKSNDNCNLPEYSFSTKERVPSSKESTHDLAKGQAAASPISFKESEVHEEAQRMKHFGSETTPIRQRSEEISKYKEGSVPRIKSHTEMGERNSDNHQKKSSYRSHSPSRRVEGTIDGGRSSSDIYQDTRPPLPRQPLPPEDPKTSPVDGYDGNRDYYSTNGYPQDWRYNAHDQYAYDRYHAYYYGGYDYGEVYGNNAYSAARGVYRDGAYSQPAQPYSVTGYDTAYRDPYPNRSNDYTSTEYRSDYGTLQYSNVDRFGRDSAVNRGKIPPPPHPPKPPKPPPNAPGNHINNNSNNNRS